MPSAEHEAIVDLFRHRPVLAAEMLRDVLALQLPAFSYARIESASFTDLALPEYAADLVVLLAAEKPALAIVLEVQLQVDEQKRYTWPYYATRLHLRLRCPTCVLVYAADEGVARWASSLSLGGPGWSFSPWVLAPNLVPVVRDAAEAAARPELAVLSAMAHGDKLPPEEAAALAATALAAVATAGDVHGLLYYDLVVASLSAAARKAFEAMDTKKYEFKTEFARRYLAEGRVEGKAEGRVEGKAEGRVEGKAEALFRIFKARGLEVPAEVWQRVSACTDGAILDRWIERAVVVPTATEVVRDDS
jgi:hypothetical protein